MDARYTFGIVIAIAVILVIILAAQWSQKRFLRSRLNTAKFKQRWQELQQLCHDQSTWPLAVIDADKLLDSALKQRGFKGKTMGERLTSAQNDLKDNDGTWQAHKLRNKLVHENVKNLKKSETMDALKGFRDALKDLGAL